MTRDGWIELVKAAVGTAEKGDQGRLDLLGNLLEEQDLAKAALSRKGYGCTGMPWANVVAEVPSDAEVQMLRDDLQYEQP